MSRTLTTHSNVGINLSTYGTANNPFTVATTGAITPSTGDGLIAKGKSTYNWTVDNFGTITSTPSSTHGIYLGPGTAIASGTIINESAGLISSGGYGVVINGPGFVTNKAGGTITAANFKAVYLIGTGTVVNAGVINSGSGTSGNVAIYEANGGVITNQPGGTINGQGGVWFNAPGTFTNFGVVIGTNSGFGAILFNSTSAPNRFIEEVTATVSGNIIAQIGGTDVIELASGSSTGTLSGFGTSITNFDTLVFDSGAQWFVSGVTAAGTVPGLPGLSAITGFTTGDTIDLTGFAAVSETFASNALVLTNSTAAHATLHIQGAFTTSNFNIASDGSLGTNITFLCFCAGTRLATPRGEVLVERLAIGDKVTTLDGQAEPIEWIGTGRVLVTPGRRSAATPVIIRKGALADNVPAQDLRVTKGHSLYIDGVLVPAEFLVNHRSILWDDAAREVEVYHIELARHGVLIANGAPAESYRDDGNRWLFQNSNDGWHLPPEPPCAPVLTGGPVVDAIWRRLLERAGGCAGMELTDHPDLHLLVDGKRLDHSSCVDGLYSFRLPARPQSVRIVSCAASPDELGIARDPRRLGVALRRIVAWQGPRVTVLAADDVGLEDGFHDYEAEHGFRWTDGDAALPRALLEGLARAGDLELHVGCTTRYPAPTVMRHQAA